MTGGGGSGVCAAVRGLDGSPMGVCPSTTVIVDCLGSKVACGFNVVTGFMVGFPDAGLDSGVGEEMTGTCEGRAGVGVLFVPGVGSR